MGYLDKIGHLLTTDAEKMYSLLNELDLDDLKVISEHFKIVVKPPLFRDVADKTRYVDVLSDYLELDKLLTYLKANHIKLYNKHMKTEKEMAFDWSGMKRSLGNSVNEDIGSLMEDAIKEEDADKEGPKGEQLENLIEAYFKSKHYKILARDLIVDNREVDLVIAKGAKAKMIEVKFRKKPISTMEHDGYMVLFKKLQRRKWPNDAHIEKLIYIAPIGGVSKGVKNDALVLDGKVEIKASEFLKELVEFQKKLRDS